VVVKPCDSRAINVLVAENAFPREQVHALGVVCEGIRVMMAACKPAVLSVMSACHAFTTLSSAIHRLLSPSLHRPLFPVSPGSANQLLLNGWSSG